MKFPHRRKSLAAGAAALPAVQIQVLDASNRGEIDAAFAALARERPDALFVSGDAFFNSRRLQLALLAARHALPASYGSRDFPDYGRLMSYGANITDAFRQVGVYSSRILKGAKPADLPGDEVRAGDQRSDRPGARPYRAGHVGRPRRRGDRVRMSFGRNGVGRKRR
jgi:ABC-type uncharacterized transport system substrate-binding protein